MREGDAGPERQSGKALGATLKILSVLRVLKDH